MERNRAVSTLLPLAVLLLALPGCLSGQASGPVDGPGGGSAGDVAPEAADPDAPPASPDGPGAPGDATPAAPEATGPSAGAPGGVYALEGLWDLSGPLGDGRSLGDVVAELVVEETVSTLPVPSRLEGRATELLDARVGDAIRAHVDARTPEALAADGPLMTALGQTLLEVEVQSELTLARDATTGAVQGEETFQSFAVTRAGIRHVVTPEELLLGASLGATWEGEAREGVLSVEPHEVTLRYDALVLWVASAALRVDLTELGAEAVSAVACDTLVEELVGVSGSFVLDLGVTQIRISADALLGGCDRALGELAGRALPYLTLDTPVVLGGDVALLDDDGDGRADGLASEEGFGGHVLVTAQAVAPRLTVSFVGERVE